MPTSRFVIVSAPLEERVAASLAARAQEALLVALRLRTRVDETLHREDLGDRTKEAIEHVSRPGGLPFILFMLLVAVLATRELLLRMETKRILRVHKLNVNVQPPSAPHQHED
tara:strand:+ start:346 stop:684 length:339 start_codon:yes stop_codon:yes gene_type:complete